jgi:hypothetical protein
VKKPKSTWKVKKKPLFTHTFRGVKFGIYEGLSEPFYAGATTERYLSKPSMVFDTRMDQKDGLEVLIHEALHACFNISELSEEKIQEAARDIASFLEKCGFKQEQ